jgi:hypothetical protein
VPPSSADSTISAFTRSRFSLQYLSTKRKVSKSASDGTHVCVCVRARARVCGWVWVFVCTETTVDGGTGRTAENSKGDAWVSPPAVVLVAPRDTMAPAHMQILVAIVAKDSAQNERPARRQGSCLVAHMSASAFCTAVARPLQCPQTVVFPRLTFQPNSKFVGVGVRVIRWRQLVLAVCVRARRTLCTHGTEAGCRANL